MGELHLLPLLSCETRGDLTQTAGRLLQAGGQIEEDRQAQKELLALSGCTPASEGERV